MGFFTLLLLGAIFVGSNCQQSQDIRQLLQEPIRQLQEPIQRFSSQYENMFERQSRPPGVGGPYNPLTKSIAEYQQLMSELPIQKSQQPQVTSQQLPKSMAESSTSTDKLRQSLETQEQALYAQELLKRDEESRKRPGSRGVTTVCVQVHSDNGNPVVCGPQIPTLPVSNQITSYKNPPQDEQAKPQEQPKPNTFTPAPIRPQFMRVPVVYQNYQLPRQQLSLRCEPDAGINRFATNYRLATAVPMPTEYGLSLGLNDQRTVVPEERSVSTSGERRSLDHQLVIGL
ncbi:uncharacterized protein LOC111044835 [Nilaparvata lugens]|uniref:uncharacterized protein LOC111044835 n=1 Tax=Nilaparvata lugens TaxID=108931 RepID=UPI00193E10A0|nr:uncharacterized protein LOC111044835 [Nilaparvata lugens]